MFKRIFYVFLTIAALGAIFFGCKKPEETSGETETGSNGGFLEEVSYAGVYNFPDDESGAYIFERIPVQHTISPFNSELPKLPFTTGAHRKYLNDPLTFKNLPDGGITGNSTAVAGSDECLFYPVSSISAADDLKNLSRGERIPLGTIIALGTQFECSDSEKADLFEFQDNLNYFYKTVWNGKEGIVFGADLYGIGKSAVENQVNSLLYKDNGYFDSFYPVTGYDEIGTEIQRELGANGLAFQQVGKNEYYLSSFHPDDMISLYQGINKKVSPVFVTTDLAAHANHLVFDRMLQYLEEEYFFPQLIKLVDEYISVIESLNGTVNDDVYNISLLYFQTAKALLALAPKKVKGNDWAGTIEYRDVNASQVLSAYPRQVADEVEKMNKAAGLDYSAVFKDMREDYSQFKVRGHYTKNGILGAYFRAMIWFGRINFILGGEEDAKEAAKRLAPVSLFITEITENSSKLKIIWRSLFDPITDLIGASDDISFYELIPLWNRVKGAGFAQWYNDSKKLETFITKDYMELRPPAIAGFSVFEGPHAGGNAPQERRPPVGWRLFGQRYTLDSEIHHHASSPRLFGRMMVRGLDILKVFGSKTADRFLKESESKEVWAKDLDKTLNQLQQNIGNIKDEYWFSTYYTNILYQIRTLALFDNGAGFYFTEKPGWSLKALNAAHGTWAELRHDTLLYVKQGYAEMGGGGDWEPTFRTKPLPEPIHYIEPNVPFWIASALGMQKIYAILEKYDCLDGNTAQVLAGMHEIFVKAAEISRLEAEDKEVSRKELTWIGEVPAMLAKLVVIHAGIVDGGWMDDPELLRMALVADVFTNAEIGVVLETAVGIPYRLYIPLNDKQGGKRIALGYGFSYYEFTQPISQRLNNDQWKAIVYKDNPDMRQYLPFWIKGKVQAVK